VTIETISAGLEHENGSVSNDLDPVGNDLSVPFLSDIDECESGAL
jgi:hypothetical protein